MGKSRKQFEGTLVASLKAAILAAAGGKLPTNLDDLNPFRDRGPVVRMKASEYYASHVKR